MRKRRDSERERERERKRETERERDRELEMNRVAVESDLEWITTVSLKKYKKLVFTT